MRHIALRVKDIKRSKHFYQEILGMEVVWEPDPQNVYLSSGVDNLALHQSSSIQRACAPVIRALLFCSNCVSRRSHL